MKKNTLLIVLAAWLISFTGCQKTPYEFIDNPTCTDGRQNGDETDVDCGGSCTPCADAALMHSRKYYISFLYDNAPTLLQSDSDLMPYNPIGSSTLKGTVSTQPNFTGSYAQLELDLLSFDINDIVELIGDTLYFEKYTSPGNRPHLSLGNLGFAYQSTTQVFGAGSAPNNYMIIDDVAIDNEKSPWNSDKLLITGRFNAKVSSSTGSTVHALTKGTFGLPFSLRD